jgi:putative flippase GtrA
MGLRRLVTLLETHQFLRFLLAGGLNTLFGFGVYALAVLAGLPVWLAMLVGTVAGVAFNFVTLGGYAFRDLSVRRLPRFVLGYAGVYAANLAAFGLVHRRVADPVACQVLLVVPVALFSYLVMSRFVFRKRREAGNP